MTAVHVLRHPETTWNVDHRYQGSLEAPLSPTGETQLRLACDLFSGAQLACVVSSPLSRARRLAEGLGAAVGCSVEIDDRLTEIGMGPWEGLVRSEIEERYPTLYAEWYTRPDLVHFPGGDSLVTVRERAIAALAAIYLRYAGTQVAVVTHSAVIQVLVASALGLDLRHVHAVRVSNCSVTTFCGASAPGMVLTVNSLGAYPGTPTDVADAVGCRDLQPRKVTQ